MEQENSYKKNWYKKNWYKKNRKLIRLLCVIVFILAVVGLGIYSIWYLWQSLEARNTQKELQTLRVEDIEQEYDIPHDEDEERTAPISSPDIMSQYQSLYETNSDMIGWLSIDDTVIDYPVMQTMEDEDYYLKLDFYGQPNQNGCLMMDTDSVVGTGTKACAYADGSAPSTNLIIHGHTMKTGEMFGDLKLYADETYGKEHSMIRFDSLYEEREYELIAVFYSQVFYESDKVFKFYKFFQADTQEEFDDWYQNIKAMSLYDTGVTAELGDEFITLSCCAYHVEDGRFVVVGKRVK
ncbi:MAG: class B sortase [Lachnospiraceae bacterium]|nr:class B sortase [Lachnospiraceae bacterium]